MVGKDGKKRRVDIVQANREARELVATAVLRAYAEKLPLTSLKAFTRYTHKCNERNRDGGSW